MPHFESDEKYHMVYFFENVFQVWFVLQLGVIMMLNIKLEAFRVLIKNFVFLGGVSSALTVATAAFAGAGNGVPSGGCYNLEIIAQKTKTVTNNENNGHRIFINIGGNTKILLQEGSFGVIDYNGTDGSAKFSLPNPDPTNSGTTKYSVFARVVGKPGSGIDMNTCGYDSAGVLYCSEQSLSMTRIAGTSKFLNVSQELLYIYADINGDGVIDRVPLFSSNLQDYYWDVDSTGRSHAQLRFCPVSTTVAAP